MILKVFVSIVLVTLVLQLVVYFPYHIPTIIESSSSRYALAKNIKIIDEINKRTCNLYGEKGWKCDPVTCRIKEDCCIFLEWVCDGEHQCIEDESDETIGCYLFTQFRLLSNKSVLLSDRKA